MQVTRARARAANRMVIEKTEHESEHLKRSPRGEVFTRQGGLPVGK